MTADGMQQWMRAHIHNFHVATVSQEGNTITLNADSSFATGASKVTVVGTATNGATGTGKMTAQATGHWSAADGHFNICAAPSSLMNGSATVAQHKALLDCALKRDVEGAKSILTDHINSCVAHALSIGTLK